LLRISVLPLTYEFDYLKLLIGQIIAFKNLFVSL
jgi:hypothetical protein